MSGDWLNSLERAVQIEDQIALAEVLNAVGVQVETGTLKRLLEAAKAQMEAE